MSQRFGILVVGDNGGNAGLWREALGRLHDVGLARDGAAALALLRREGAHVGAPRPDIILLDLDAARADGLGALRDIKCDPALRRIPVIALMAPAADDLVREAYSLHANACVAKPADPDRFADGVRAIEDFFLSVARLPDRPLDYALAAR